MQVQTQVLMDHVLGNLNAYFSNLYALIIKKLKTLLFSFSLLNDISCCPVHHAPRLSFTGMFHDG